jgi:type II secretory pathway pseudopilin PulG
VVTPRTNNPITPARGRRGLSLPEAMISLAITAMLLVAVATAFSGASQAIELNDTFFRCSQAARVTMDQLLGEVRNCDSLDMNTANTIKIIRPAPGSGQYARQASETERDFVYDSANSRITLQIFYSGGTSSPVYELATNVAACAFGPVDMGLDYNNATIPIHIPITLTVRAGVGNTVSSVVLNGSAGPRRATKY